MNWSVEICVYVVALSLFFSVRFCWGLVWRSKVRSEDRRMHLEVLKDTFHFLQRPWQGLLTLHCLLPY